MSRGELPSYGTCRSCHRRIWWVQKAANKRPHPFDPEPNLSRGDWLIDDDDQAHQLTAAQARIIRREFPREGLYLSHFDNCGRRSEHRRLMPPGPYADLGDGDDETTD